MRLTRTALALLVLAACNTPSPGFRGIEAQRVTVEGSVFDVRVAGAEAEAIRVNSQYAPRMGPIGGRAAVAIEQVSGCAVSGVSGDQAMIRARLSCGGAAPPAAQARGYECSVTRGLGGEKLITCDPV